MSSAPRLQASVMRGASPDAKRGVIQRGLLQQRLGLGELLLQSGLRRGR